MENLQAVFIVLSDPEQVEKALNILVDCEIRGATIIESTGMGQVLTDTLPVIGSLRRVIAEQHEHNRTIFAVSRHPEKIDLAVERISEEFNRFEEPCSGVLFVLPVLKAVGFGRKDDNL